MTNKQLKWDDFTKELLSIPSNAFIAKVLNQSSGCIAAGRGFYGKVRAGHFKESPKNNRNFLKMLVPICIKHNRTVNNTKLNTLEKIEILRNPAGVIVMKAVLPQIKKVSSKLASNGWSKVEEEKVWAFHSLKTSDRKSAEKLLAIELGRSFSAVDKKFSNLKLSYEELNNISALAEVRQRLAVATKPLIVKTSTEKEISTQTEIDKILKIEGIENLKPQAFVELLKIANLLK